LHVLWHDVDVADHIDFDPASLRSGEHVWVAHRPATFLYLWQLGAVVRYPGDPVSRVVMLGKLQPGPPGS
jgi:hypothetical protein